MSDKASDTVLSDIANDAEPWHDYGDTVRSMARELIELRAKVVAEPVAWMWQHGETGACGFLENAPKEDLERWERMNKPRKVITPLIPRPTSEKAG